MRRRMIHYIRAVFFKDRIHTLAVAHRADKRYHIKLRVGAFKLVLNIVSIIFVNIKNNKLFGRMLCNLAAQLAAYGSAAARNKNRFPRNIIYYAVNVKLDRARGLKGLLFQPCVFSRKDRSVSDLSSDKSTVLF